MTVGPDTKYFLSCYLSPPDGLSVIAPRHDQNIALWRTSGARVDLVRVWELERVSGQKHHYWPIFTVGRYNRVLAELLAAEGLSPEDVSACWGTPGLPRHAEIRMPAGSEDFPVHSLAHLYSGLLLDSEIFRSQTIVGMAVDGRPDFGLDQEGKKYWYAGCVSRKGSVSFSPVESPAPIYDAATARFGSEPGTLMALASACPTEIDFDTEAAVRDLELFGGQRVPLVDTLVFLDEVIRSARSQLPSRELDGRFTEREHLQSAVMKVVQTACEIVMVRNMDRLLDSGAVDPSEAYLSLSGGFALNCPTNSFLLRRYGFRGLLIPPCANDSGQALGLGLLALHGTGHLPDGEFRLATPYRGALPTDVDAALRQFDEFVVDVQPFTEARFVEDICRGPLVWADGAAEIGPRALGARSILADPRTLSSKDRLNEWKNRQWWRPVAPIVLEEHTGEWFDEPGPSPYMLQTAFVREDKRPLVPAILHLDDSARHQTLAQETNPLLHRAIEAFRQETGIPMLCNTSLNEKGEPIVDTAAQALSFAVRKNVAVAYIAGRRVLLRSDDQGQGPAAAGRHPRRQDLFAGQEPERDEIWDSWVGAGYGTAAMVLMARSPELRDQELATPEVVNQLAEVASSRDESGTLTLAAEKHARMFGPTAVFDPDSQEGATF
ncbi:carbamoyltransferase C-terminal domain-containing protein [Actinophytocola oryzae]|uniref:Putative NodU family carbamoyl transferase n=1 Tax=Actinophytocola oryzae TaxID=502181 RepID=A0A4R7VJZ9_9PSEU|nr:carbamoyltransferase C-terminal domain-containing protein [Actinophytocola oryzae]TDV49796.1 putative NodU family carbamoyl transferase [Actinophytocola oryzae]